MQPSFIPPSRLPPWRIPPADSRPSPPPPAPRSSYLRPRPRPGDEQDMQRPSPPFGAPRPASGSKRGGKAGRDGNKKTRDRAEWRRRKAERERTEERERTRYAPPTAGPASPPRDRSPFTFQFPLQPLPAPAARSPSPRASSPPRPTSRIYDPPSPPGPRHETHFQRSRRKRRREEEEREAEGVWERVLEEEWELRRTRRRRDAELTGLVKEVEGGEEGEVWEVSWEGREGNDEDPLKRVANRAWVPPRPLSPYNRLSVASSNLYGSSHRSPVSTSLYLRSRRAAKVEEQGKVREVSWHNREEREESSSRFRPGSPTWPTAPAIPLPPVDRPAATSAVYTSSYLSRFSTSPSLPRTSLPLFPSAAHLPDPASECEQRLSPSPAQSSADFVPFSHSSPPSPPRIARNCHEVSFDKPMKPSSISITGGGSNSLPAFLQPGFLSRPPASPSRPGSGFVPSSSSAFDLLFRFKSGLVGLSVVAFSSLPTPSHPSPTPLPRPPLSPWPVNPVQAEPVSPLKDALGGEDAAMAAVEKSQGADRAHGSA